MHSRSAIEFLPSSGFTGGSRSFFMESMYLLISMYCGSPRRTWR